MTPGNKAVSSLIITPSETTHLGIPLLSSKSPVFPSSSSGLSSPLACSVHHSTVCHTHTHSAIFPEDHPQESRPLEISRNGLTLLSTTSDLLGDVYPLSGVEPHPSSPTYSNEPSAALSPAHLGKRPAELQRRMAQSTFESPSKKPRLAPPFCLPMPSLPPTPGEPGSNQPDFGSPLDFSKSAPSRPLPGRPPSFKASGTAPSIISVVEVPPTKLRLPKGQVNAASPPQSSGTPGSWASNDVPAASHSPGNRALASPARLHQGIGVTEFLDADPRPAFVVDLDDPANLGPGHLRVMYANASLRAASSLIDLLEVDTAESTVSRELSRFKEWVIMSDTSVNPRDGWPLSAEYGGVDWTCLTLRRLRFVCCNSSVADVTPSSLSMLPLLPAAEGKRRSETNMGPEASVAESDYFGILGDASSFSNTHPGASSTSGSRPSSVMDEYITPTDEMAPTRANPTHLQTTFDWTRIPLDDPNLGEHHRLSRSVDWASTPLGPVEHWPPDLRMMSNMIMGSPHPAAMYWGEEHVAIYNEAYVSLAGEKHPRLMGARYEDVWPEIWSDIQPVLKGAWNHGDATMKYDDLLFISQNGFLEERYFDWALIPLVGADGSVVAVSNPAFENTQRKIGERRMLTLRELGIQTSLARDTKGFWSQVLKGLEFNELDAPFALLYSFDDGNESEASSMHSGGSPDPPQLMLEGSIGVPDNHPCAVPRINLGSSEEGFAPYMRESMADLTVPVVLSAEDGTLPDHLLQGLAWRGFGDPCRTIVVFPIHPTNGGDSAFGFIVLGINPRRRYDADYHLFVNLLSRQLATSLASVVLFEEEIRRGLRAARLAALDRQNLSEQLLLQKQEAVESEFRFTRMANFGPVGMFIADGDGHITYCNDMWSQISGRPRETHMDSWMQSVRGEDRVGVESAWRRLVIDKVAITHEFRFQGSRRLNDGHSVDIWALMSAYPEKDEFGALKSIFGCITDISQQKWAEDFQKRGRDEAVERKRQQENFIDITSHEMRNPLSAILQCADEIMSWLNRYKNGDALLQAPSALSQLVDSCAAAASTISLCANHQKKIIDDILTVSKLDSSLVVVTPVDVQPVTVVQNVLKMFESELASHDIKGHFQIEQSYTDLDINWVKLDPSCLGQVLSYIMTNAIKCTQGRPTRSITVKLGASKDGGTADVSYISPRGPNHSDITDGADWADGEKLYLHVSVTDTGPGLDDDDKKILFQRFSQSSPRTHVQYGGSGLSLFICRSLIEIQGGQIGVQSRKGDGATFAFYIKARKADGPRSGLSYATLTPRNSTKMFDVLIVEDNKVNQNVLRRQLQLLGHKTHVANHGVEALEALQCSRFWYESKGSMDMRLQETPIATDADGKENNRGCNVSVILMDLEMPKMDGISCTREIRRLERAGVLTQHIPIIAVTAYTRPEQIEDAKAAGVVSSSPRDSMCDTS